MELIDHMEDILARNLTGQYGHGRGIVMVAGNADTLQRVKWTLMMLRGYGSGLPVQIVSGIKLDSISLSFPIVPLPVRGAWTGRPDS